MNENKTYILTKEQIQKAKSYMPEPFKEEISSFIAESCISPVKNETAYKEVITLPPMVKENVSLRNILLMRELLEYYIGIEFVNDEMDYDLFAGSHILNQLERMKSIPELKEKVFDILADFKDFKKYVDTKIYDLKTERNDPLNRLNKGLELIVADPDFIAKVKELLENAKNGPSFELVKNDVKH